MPDTNYLKWLADETITQWWHDSGDPGELTNGKKNGAVGVTTNPVLSYTALKQDPDFWEKHLKEMSENDVPREKAEYLTSCVVKHASDLFLDTFNNTNQQHGFVCGQIDPSAASETELMIDMARRFSTWAPNVSVKFPATLAGLDAFEECSSEGISGTSTVSFTVPQVIAAAERYEKGKKRAELAGIKPKPGYAVIMIGRIDDYLREIIHDRKAPIEESMIIQAGIAITKRAYQIFKEREYHAKLIIAALRGTYHMTSICGADVIMSIHPKIQKALLKPGVERTQGITDPVAKDVIHHLSTIPEFVKAYEPDGMREEDFITFGVCQKTLGQFHAGGWKLLENI